MAAASEKCAGGDPGHDASGARRHPAAVGRPPPLHARWSDYGGSAGAAPFVGRSNSGSRRFVDLFPLPLLEGQSAPLHSGGSRTAHRRRHLRQRARDDANSAILALNALYGAEGPPGPLATDAQLESQRHIISSCRAARHGFVDHTPEGAARELLGSRWDYIGEGCRVVAYEKDKVSLPRLGSDPVVLERVLDREAVGLLQEFEDRLLVEDEIGDWRARTHRVGSYTDVVLRKDRRAYVGFVQELVSRGLVRASRVRKAAVTPFFVAKKAGQQRLVLDCRRSNSLFRHAPPMEIGSSESLSSVDVPTGTTLFSASADIEACFYQCGLPPSLGEYFCPPKLTYAEAQEAGLHLDTFSAGSDSAAYPALTVVPKGWAWAMWFVQRVHVHLAIRAGFPEGQLAYGSWPFPEVVSQCAELPYCDNITVVGVCKKSVTMWRDRILREFEEAGFSMHEVSDTVGEAVILGSDLGGPRPSARRTLPKLWLLRGALEWLQARPFVSGRQVEIVVGHVVAACLYRRAGLSVPRALYSFISDSYYFPQRLWASAAYECWIFQAPISDDHDHMPSVAFFARIWLFGVCRVRLVASRICFQPRTP